MTCPRSACGASHRGRPQRPGNDGPAAAAWLGVLDVVRLTLKAKES